jgi:type IV fimbrial biogenesis protein FimT
MKHERMPRTRGFTTIELMIVIVVIGVLLMLAAPSFTKFMAKKRVEGLVSELVVDLGYARSEAVQRNTLVQVTLGSGCYVIHALPAGTTAASDGTSCPQTGNSTIGTGEAELKTVQVAADSAVSLTPTTGTILFEPVRGRASFSSGSASLTLTAASSIGAWTLRATIASVGRVSTCSPSGAGNVAGYGTC